MLGVVKAAGKRLFGAFGLEVRKKTLEPPPPRASMIGALQQLKGLGLRPEAVIDVGAASETIGLYDLFSESRILLIEPLAEFEPQLKRICGRHGAQYVLAAAGAARGMATLNVHPDGVGSSLLKEVEGPSVDGTPREVPVVTLDEICAEKNFWGPYLIKVDVQGAELQVLAGAQRTLLETEAVILEVTLFGTMIGGPQLHDVVTKMKEYGFVVYDAFGFHYRPLDDALCQLDVVFVRENGRFRESHAYATPQQRGEQFSSARLEFAVPGPGGKH
jgi:FkbM family methyltransferase